MTVKSLGKIGVPYSGTPVPLPQATLIKTNSTRGTIGKTPSTFHACPWMRSGESGPFVTVRVKQMKMDLFNNAPTIPDGLPVEKQVDWWFERRHVQRLAKERRDAENRNAQIERHRDMLLKGEWEPACTCRDCIRAVLSSDPSLICEKGRRLNEYPWWK